MIGCHAIADTEEFEVDGIELSEGRWFTREEAKAIIEGKGDGTAWFPPPFAIAHQLIKAFAEGEV
jgi:NAD+ diphosphatase